MRILYIACIQNDKYAGVNVSIIQRLKFFSLYNEVFFLNLSLLTIDDITCQVFLDEKQKAPFVSLLDKVNPDIVVFNEVYRPQYLKIYPILVKKKIKYIIIPHGELSKVSQRKKFIKKKIANLFLFSNFIRKASCVQFLSEREKQQSIFNKQSFVSPNGIIECASKKIDFKRSKRLIYVGRLEVKIKGLDLLIRAVNHISVELRHANYKILIYGPDYKNRRKKLCALIKKFAVDDLIIVNDKITGCAKIEELISSDFFVQTSRTEGLPMGIIEALNVGLPCLITEGTSLSDEINLFSAGLTSKNSYKAIANMLLKSLNMSDEELVMMSQNAVRLSQERFNWNNICVYETEVYKKILGEGR